MVLDDGTVVSGWGEKNLENAREGDIVQLERMYFARLDKKGDKKGKTPPFIICIPKTASNRRIT